MSSLVEEPADGGLPVDREPLVSLSRATGIERTDRATTDRNRVLATHLMDSRQAYHSRKAIGVNETTIRHGFSNCAKHLRSGVVHGDARNWHRVRILAVDRCTADHGRGSSRSHSSYVQLSRPLDAARSTFVWLGNSCLGYAGWRDRGKCPDRRNDESNRLAVGVCGICAARVFVGHWFLFPFPRLSRRGFATRLARACTNPT